MVNPYEVAVVPSAKEEFVSADPDVADGEALAPGRGATGSGGFSGVGDDAFAFLAPGEAELAIHDYEDTLIRTEQATLERTFVGEGGERLPDSWVVPPGGGVPGGYPGYRREAAVVDYSGSPGVSYFPPPSIDSSYRGGSYRGGSHSYPYSGTYHPGGPYAYRYDGMVPLGDPGVHEDARYEFEGGVPFISRQFNPEEAHFKAGPCYFEAVWVETGVLYSDYHGPTVFAPGEEDGWLGFASFRFRMTAELGPSLYLSADGELFYLFKDNELGFRSGLDGAPFATLSYETQIGSWDFRAYAEFGTGSINNLFGSPAYEQAGRYSFGFYGRYDDGLLYDPYLYTRVGVEANTLVNPDWRLSLFADHTDYWYVGGDSRGEDHWAREHVGVLYGAEPNRIPFTPWFSYDLYSDDFFESAYHTFYAGGSGRLSENVFFDGRAGYFLATGEISGQNHWLWDIGLRHRINQRTTHGIRFGQDFFMSDFSIDSTVSSFFQYYIDHQFTERLRGRAYAQWSTDEFLSGPLVGGEYETEQYGVWLDYVFTDRLRGSLGYMEQVSHNTGSGYGYYQSIFQARLDAQVGLRSTAYLLYQHEDTDFYYEDLYMAGILRYF